MHFLHIIFFVEANLCVTFLQTKSQSRISYKQNLRIIGGRDALPGEFPYVVKLEAKVEYEGGLVQFFHVCTGSLLTHTWSVTSAHCTRQLGIVKIKSKTVKGIVRYNLSSTHNGSYSHVLSIFKHPNHSPLKKNARNDIALLKSEEIAISVFAKLSPVDYVTLYGTKVMALGYGITINADNQYGDAHSLNKSLQVLEAMITKCFKSRYQRFCLGGICGKWSTLCPGDSGGPVLHASGLIGLNTAIPFHCDKNLAEFYNFKGFSGFITAIKLSKSQSQTYKRDLRVIGGRDALPGEFPYVVKLEAKLESEGGSVQFFHVCTGSLLTHTWSVTSAHCTGLLGTFKINSTATTNGIIRYNLSSTHDGSYSNILKIVNHPHYFPPINYHKNDFALLKSEEIAISVFVKLSPIDYVTLYGTKVVALGYGITINADNQYDDAHSLNKSLQVLEAMVTKCFKLYYQTFCLGGICGKLSTICSGDSGGPVLHASGLIGLNTAGYSCFGKDIMKSKLRTFNGFITGVSSYIDWIRNVID